MSQTGFTARFAVGSILRPQKPNPNTGPRKGLQESKTISKMMSFNLIIWRMSHVRTTTLGWVFGWSRSSFWCSYEYCSAENVYSAVVAYRLPTREDVRLNRALDSELGPNGLWPLRRPSTPSTVPPATADVCYWTVHWKWRSGRA